MAEFSGLWTTGGATGDQQASYTQAQLAIMHKIIAACSGFEGVAPGFLNELAVAANGANTVSVATGGAMVDGLFYHNDASQNVNIPSASGGGNTRIDRIVLRADWAGFNVSVHRIAGVDAASPTPPAITQTSGTTYDIMLAQVLVTTAGAVTVTDERTWAAIDLSRTREIFLPAGTGAASTGDPPSSYNNFAAWAAPDLLTTDVYWNWLVPTDYVSGTVQARIYWGCPKTGNGQFRLRTLARAAGESTAAAAEGDVETQYASAGSDLLNVASPALAVAVSPGDLVSFRVTRTAGHPLDTLGDTVYFLGLEIEYTSDR